jgi:hypothetical protein
VHGIHSPFRTASFVVAVLLVTAILFLGTRLIFSGSGSGDSLIAYIIRGNWTKGVNLFAFTSILIRMKKQYTFGGNFPFFVREMSKVAGATVLAICGCMLIKAISLPWPSLAVSALAAVVGVLVFVAVLFVTKSKVMNVELG